MDRFISGPVIFLPRTMLEGYDLDLDRIVRWIKKGKYKTVGLQLPEGLKIRHRTLAEALEERTSVIPIYVTDPCFGACDLADETMASLGIDALIHFGHSPLSGKTKVPTLFVPLDITIPIDKVVKKAAPMLRSPVGLLTTVQHLKSLGRVEEILKEKGLKVLTSKGTRAKQKGQVLGCSYGALHALEGKAKTFLFIGGGKFHPLGAALSTSRKVVAADPFMGTVEDMSPIKDRLLRQRHGLITKARYSQNFAIIVGTKSGQRRLALAKHLRKVLLDNLRGVQILALQAITPENLLGIDAEVFVSTACPRVALDDCLRFDRPILTPPELEIALDLRSWDDYILDEF
jgi:2-(3-amino-3-carboxypropyl)histidine synthase